MKKIYLTLSMKLAVFISVFILVFSSCGADDQSISDSDSDPIVAVDQIFPEWFPPIDTLDVIEENYWEAHIDSIEKPSYLYPSNGSTVFFGYEYFWLDIKGDTLFFESCQQGAKYEFGVLISLVTEDSLILTFLEGNKFGLKKGSQMAFENDKKYAHEDFRLQKISYSTADPMQHRSSFSVEFDSSKFVYKNWYINGGNDVISCHQGETPPKLFKDIQEILSKLQLSQVFKGPKSMEFLEPYKLLVNHNDIIEKIEGHKYALPPRLNQLIEKLESGGPRNNDFLEMLGFSLAGREELTKLKDYNFDVGEIELTNDHPIPIDNVEEVEEMPETEERFEE